MLNVFLRWKFPLPTDEREEMLSISASSSLQEFRQLIIHTTRIAEFDLFLGTNKKIRLEFDQEMKISDLLFNYCVVVLEVKEGSSILEVKEKKTLTDLSQLLQSQHFTTDRIKGVQIDDNSIWTFNNILSSEECNRFMIESEKLGFEKLRGDPRYRTNLRLVVEDLKLAENLWARMSHLSLFRSPMIWSEKKWSPCGLNPSFRFCRYSSGDFFDRHCDANFTKNANEISIYTVNIYLNEDFRGGQTRFFLDEKDTQKVTHAITPTTGLFLIFDHTSKEYLHDGAKVDTNFKYLLRTDVMARSL